MVVPGFYDEARTNSTVAPEEVIDEVEPKKQPMKLMVDRETIIGNGEVNLGDSLILDTNTFSKTYLDINTQSIPINLIAIIVGNLLQEKINEIDRELKRFEASASNSHGTTSTVIESYTNQVSSETLGGHVIINPSSHDIRNTHSHHLTIHDFTKVCVIPGKEKKKKKKIKRKGI